MRREGRGDKMGWERRRAEGRGYLTSPGQTRFCSRIFVFGQFRFPLITLLSHIGSRLSREHAPHGFGLSAENGIPGSDNPKSARSCYYSDCSWRGYSILDCHLSMSTLRIFLLAACIGAYLLGQRPLQWPRDVRVQ